MFRNTSWKKRCHMLTDACIQSWLDNKSNYPLHSNWQPDHYTWLAVAPDWLARTLRHSSLQTCLSAMQTHLLCAHRDTVRAPDDTRRFATFNLTVLKTTLTGSWHKGGGIPPSICLVTSTPTHPCHGLRHRSTRFLWHRATPATVCRFAGRTFKSSNKWYS